MDSEALAALQEEIRAWLVIAGSIVKRRQGN
jgi:hypothetical protein